MVPVNEIAFVDDLLSFLIFVSWEHLTGWVQAVRKFCWRQWDEEMRVRTVTLAPEKWRSRSGDTNWSQRKKQCSWASASTSVDRWLERLMSV